MSPAAAPALDGGITPPLLSCANGEIPPNVALARLLIGADSREAAEAAIVAARRRLDFDLPASTRLGALARLWRETPGAWELVRGVTRAADTRGHAGAQRWGDVFDAAAEISPAAAAAVYCLGRDDLLEAATASIVARLEEWNLVGPDAHVLDIGCGPGRLAVALAPKVRSVTGLDVSGAMLESAWRRSAGLANVRLMETDGRSLRMIADKTMDLVLAVDVFPYLVTIPGLAEAHFAEIARVLKAGGALLLLNYSYRRVYDADVEVAASLASDRGLRVSRIAAGDFALWDRRTYLFHATP